VRKSIGNYQKSNLKFWQCWK